MIKRNIKRILKKILVFLFAKDIRALEKVDISKYDVISFDIFDTLIKRKCGTPENVFDIVQDKYERITNIKMPYSYKERRIFAEKRARQCDQYQEIQFDNIFSYLNGFSETEKDLLKELELETEYEQIIINEEMVSFYKQISGDNKNLILVSDMYLSYQFIEKILDKVGIIGYSCLYLSSKEKVTKSSGKLFKLIKMKYKNKSIFHIGDNPIADFVRARINGYKSFLYKT